MSYPITYFSPHFMVLPSTRFWNSPSDLNYVISFSGIANTRLRGNPNGTHHKDVLQLSITEMRMDKIMERVSPHLPPLPAGTNAWAFVPIQWTVNAGLNNITDIHNSENASFGVEMFKLRRVAVRASQNNNLLLNVIDGLDINLDVRGIDAFIFQVGYHTEVYGYFSPYFFPQIP